MTSSNNQYPRKLEDKPPELLDDANPSPGEPDIDAVLARVASVVGGTVLSLIDGQITEIGNNPEVS